MTEKKELQYSLLKWFAAYQRPLPWRIDYIPYQVWISEIMGQQTQMDRVVEYFKRWCEKYPDIASLAIADQEEAYNLWEGLGYYRRVQHLLQTAKIIMTDHDGLLPDKYAALLALPGIGTYTANAIMSIAYNQNYPVIDANVERIFARLFDIPTPVRTAKKFIHHKACDLLPSGEARMFNQALMELGALICTAKNPVCHRCPVERSCEAKQQGTVNERPIRSLPKKAVPIHMATGIILVDGKIYIQKRMADDVWANLWEFPGGRLQNGEEPLEAMVREVTEETGFSVTNPVYYDKFFHSYTIYRVTLYCFFCELDAMAIPTLHAAQDYRWVLPEELCNFAFPAGHRKCIESLLKNNRLLKG